MSSAAHTPVTPLEGELDRNGTRYRVHLLPESRFSLGARLLDAKAPPHTEFDACFVTHGSRTIKLTRCRLDPVHDRDHLPWRLTFLDDVYDCAALFSDGRVTNLLGFFSELPLVLAQREGVGQGFRAFVADLSYDLTVYKKFFDEQDRALEREPAEVAQQARAVLLARAGKELHRYVDAMLGRLGELVRELTPEQQERHGFYFRQQMWSFIELVPITLRTNVKPRGYAGDAVMMQMIYDDTWEGSTSFGQVLHKHAVGHAAAQAVRNRRKLVDGHLRQLLAQPRAGPVRALSVACGPAREVEDFYRSREDCQRVALTLLDQDPEALQVAADTVARVSAALGAPIDVKTVSDSVRTILRARDLPGRIGRFDFVYSMGLFDYLTPPVATAVLSRLYEVLEPGGVAVLGNYHVANASRYYMAYWHDWNLYYRTEDEMIALAAGLPGAKVSLELDDTRCQMFLRVERTA